MTRTVKIMHKFDRKRGKSEGDLYIEGYPRLSKWINECKCCHRRGYKPDLPEQIGVVEGNLASYNIKKYYQPLALDENGYCDVCNKLVK